MVRRIFWACSIIAFLCLFSIGFYHPKIFYALLIILPLFLLGVYDVMHKKMNILRLYPVIGHLRYMLEGIRPEIQQYFIETNTDGMPFSREDRELVYQRANKTLDTMPFGTQRDVYAPGFDSINHSITPKVVGESEARVMLGGPQCTKPLSASRLNISAMSYGSISKNAVMALNRAAKMGNFFQNTGEGGLTPYHLSEGGDIVWEIASGYFGCRTLDGRFDPIVFRDKAQLDAVKAIEIKLSQGAKPGHGGVLPAIKVTREIAAIRGVAMGVDCISPASHSEFSTPTGLLHFVAKLRELSGGKPVGFKLCVGNRFEFYGICKAMLATGIYPDFITVDGKEGGTGAAPVEFSDSIGLALNEGLVFVQNAIVGIGLRDSIRIIASGKIITGFDMVSKMALGADMCNSARGMMFALGCVQSCRCNKNTCPTGVTTQKPERVYALNVNDKAPRVRNFHEATIKSFMEVLGAAGLSRVAHLTPAYLYRRQSVDVVKRYDEIYTFLKPGQLLRGDNLDQAILDDWERSSPDKF